MMIEESLNTISHKRTRGKQLLRDIGAGNGFEVLQGECARSTAVNVKSSFCGFGDPIPTPKSMSRKPSLNLSRTSSSQNPTLKVSIKKIRAAEDFLLILCSDLRLNSSAGRTFDLVQYSFSSQWLN